MLTHPHSKYSALPPIALPDRQWPNRQLTTAPAWLSTDLRDGNQALAEPMGIEQKLRYFDRLVAIGFKQIEVAFPAASQTDFDFVRRLIDEKRIPDDVTLQVISQARQDLIERSFAALRGAPRAIMHIYNATAPGFRRIVFQHTPEQTIALAVDAARWVAAGAAAAPETEWTFQYSPETFSTTELSVAKAVCDAVTDVWQASPQRKVIINLPATVEAASPNVFADQIEWMHRHLARRDGVILSVHPHNDRGCAVAAAELAQLAGAERVEGCLFGNGERTGNVDLVTLALNLYSQGVAPGLDFSHLDEIARLAEASTGLPIHPRHPYAGELVYTAFSGSHQDAIKKGFAVQRADGPWQVPYLPIDPKDVGRDYAAVVRVNSQSGKGGMAYLLQEQYGVQLPRRMQIDFASVVQQHADRDGAEIDAAQLWRLFSATYLTPQQPFDYLGHQWDGHNLELYLADHGRQGIRRAIGSGPLGAACKALGGDFEVVDFVEHALSCGAEAKAIAYIELSSGEDGQLRCFAAGIDADSGRAAIRALIAAAGRLRQQRHGAAA